MATAQDYIYMSLRNCGQLRPGYTSGPELLNDGLLQLQYMFDRWNSVRTNMYSEPDYVFPVTGPGHGTTGNGQTFGGTGYQIGPTAADFVVSQRPEKIARMNLYLTSSSPTSPARVPLEQISMQEWMDLPILQFPATNVTTTFAYDPQWPNGVIWVYPPLNGNSLEIFTWGFLTAPTTLASAMSFPPGYIDAIIWDLTCRMWPLVTLDAMPHKLPLAQCKSNRDLAIADVRRVNAPKPRMRCDFQTGRGGISASSDWGALLTGVPY